MKTVELKEASASLADYARKVREPLVVTEDGKPLAALVPLDEEDLESLALGTNPEFLKLLEKSRARLKEGGAIPAAEMRRRFGSGGTT